MGLVVTWRFTLLKLWKGYLALKSMACTPILEKVRFQILLKVRLQIPKIQDLNINFKIKIFKV